MRERPWTSTERWLKVVRSSQEKMITGVVATPGVVGGAMCWLEGRTYPACPAPGCPRCSDGFQWWEGRLPIILPSGELGLWIFPTHVMHQLATLLGQIKNCTGVQVRCERRNMNANRYKLAISHARVDVPEFQQVSYDRLLACLTDLYRCELSYQALAPIMYPESGRVQRVSCKLERSAPNA